MTSTVMDVCELRNKLLPDGNSSVRVANLIGSLEQKDNANQILLDGRARRKTSFIRGTDDWHEVLLPLKPAAAALGIDESACQESLLIQIGACNLRCWYCFVDANLISGAQEFTKAIRISDIIDFLKANNRYRIVHVSGGEPLLAAEFTNNLQGRLAAEFGGEAPYLWMETNLTVSPFDLPLESFRALEKMLAGKRMGVVGCFRSIVPESYKYTIGNLDVNWFKQFAAAKALCDMGADFYATTILMVDGLKDIRSKIRYFFDTYERFMGEESLSRVVPIEIRLYTPTKARLARDQEKLIRSQYEVLPVWLEIQREYLGDAAFESVPMREKAGAARS